MKTRKDQLISQLLEAVWALPILKDADLDDPVTVENEVFFRILQAAISLSNHIDQIELTLERR